MYDQSGKQEEPGILRHLPAASQITPFRNPTTSRPGALDLGQWEFSSLTWCDEAGHYDVYSPIAVRAFEFAGPTEVNGGGTDGSLDFDVKFGYSGDYTAVPHGLVSATTQADTVDDDPANDINTALGTCDFGSFPFVCTGITLHAVAVAPGSAYLRISLFDEYTDGDDDLDLYVFNSGLGFVGQSGSATSAEQVDVLQSADTLYFVAVHGWQTDGPDANFTLFDWSFLGDEGNMSIMAPSSATLGVTELIGVDWAGLATGTKYLGAVSHSDTSGIFDMTLVNIQTD